MFDPTAPFDEGGTFFSESRAAAVDEIGAVVLPVLSFPEMEDFESVEEGETWSGEMFVWAPMDEGEGAVIEFNQRMAV